MADQAGRLTYRRIFELELGFVDVSENFYSLDLGVLLKCLLQ